jgi:two-component sensor histidine kinase/PAS domain-containing protein
MMARAKTAAGSAKAAAAARRLAGPASAVLFVVLATLARMALGNLLPRVTVFSLYYPAILGAALIGGELAAAVALATAFVCSWYALRAAASDMLPPEAMALNLALFAFTGAFVGAVGARLRGLLRRRATDIERLADREARYRALFEGVSEGFSLVEGVWNESGKLVDLMTVEANPAILKMFDIKGPAPGRRQSELIPAPQPEYMAACERAFRGEHVRLELPGYDSRGWFELRMSPAGENKVAQIIVDITERKAAESRQTEMFDELNHRVKNNLAAVSAMLGMQARLADDPRVREQLQKAIDRIQTIGDVHASLYRVSSVDEVDLAAYLQRLCERLSGTVVDGERVRVLVDADPVMRPLDEAVALGLIVNELVTNAAKYAYPPPASGVIRVALKQAPPDGLVLRVSDEGAGLTGASEGRGIGMRLVRSLVQQCRGELDIENKGGASFTVHLQAGELHQPEPAQSRLL